MKRRDWIRLYTRMIDSPQVVELDDAEFRLLIGLWCLANSSDVPGSVPYSVRGLQRRLLPHHSQDAVAAMVEHLIDLDLLQPAPDGNGFLIPRWDKHQYVYPSWTPEAQRERRANRVDQPTESHDQPISSGDQAVIKSLPSLEEEGEGERDSDGDVLAPPAPPSRARTREAAIDPESLPEDATDVERDVVSAIRAVPGLNHVPAATVLAHYREIVRIRGPCSPATERLEAIRFRDYWQERRKSTRGSWRNWRNAVTNWFGKTQERGHAADARTTPAYRANGRAGEGTLPGRSADPFKPRYDYDRYARVVRANDGDDPVL